MQATSSPPMNVPPTGAAAAASTLDFHPVTRIVSASGRCTGSANSWANSAPRVLLVTDPGLRAAGHPERAVKSLREGGLEVFVFDAVEENPTTRTSRAWSSLARAGIDCIVAVGGGSSMDCARASTSC